MQNLNDNKTPLPTRPTVHVRLLLQLHWQPGAHLASGSESIGGEYRATQCYTQAWYFCTRMYQTRPTLLWSETSQEQWFKTLCRCSRLWLIQHGAIALIPARSFPTATPPA